VDLNDKGEEYSMGIGEEGKSLLQALQGGDFLKNKESLDKRTNRDVRNMHRIISVFKYARECTLFFTLLGMAKLYPIVAAMLNTPQIVTVEPIGVVMFYMIFFMSRAGYRKHSRKHLTSFEKKKLDIANRLYLPQKEDRTKTKRILRNIWRFTTN